MSFMDSVPFPILTAITLVPLAGALLLLFLNRQSKELLRWVALVFMLIDFVVSLFAYSLFDPSSAAMHLVENRIWVRDWGISYKMGIGGISLFLVLLTTLLGPIVILASWKDIKVRVKEFLNSLLFLQVGVLGVFVSLAGSVSFLCVLGKHADPHVPADRSWGNPARRLYAAIKFVLYTIVGSLLMLVAILAQVLDCIGALMGPAHAYTHYFRDFVEQAEKASLLTGEGILVATKEQLAKAERESSTVPPGQSLTETNPEIPA